MSYIGIMKTEKPKVSLDALRKALKMYESQAEFAKAVGKTQGHVSQWLIRGRVSAETAVEIEIGTGGKIKRSQLRPDLFGKASAA